MIDNSWTKGEHLLPTDKSQLKHIQKLLEKGDIAGAMEYACYSCETAVREEIPATVWLIMGGTLLPKGKERHEKEKGKIFFQGQEKFAV